MASGKAGESLMSGVERQLAQLIAQRVQDKEEIDRLREIVINDGGPDTHQSRIISLEKHIDKIEERHQENRKFFYIITASVIAGVILQLLQLLLRLPHS